MHLWVIKITYAAAPHPREPSIWSTVHDNGQMDRIQTYRSESLDGKTLACGSFKAVENCCPGLSETKEAVGRNVICMFPPSFESICCKFALLVTNKYLTLPVVSEAFSLCDIRAAICIMNNFTTAHLQPHKQACKHHEDQTRVSVTLYYNNRGM